MFFLLFFICFKNVLSCTDEHFPNSMLLKTYCEGRIKCFHRTLDYNESFCMAENITLDFEKFQQYLHFPIENGHIDKYALNGDPPLGLFYSNCLFDADISLFHHGSSHDFRASFENRNEKCTNVEEEDTVFLSKLYGKNNLWHASEDLLHTYESSLFWNWTKAKLLVLDLPNNMTVKKQALPYFSIYQKVFASRSGYHSLWRYVKKKKNLKCILFRKTFWQAHGGSSAFQRSVGQPSSCKQSPLMRGFIDKILLATAISKIKMKDMIVVAIRNLSTVRQIIVPEWTNFLNRIQENKKVLIVDFAAFPILQQLKIARQAKKLIGLHGGALTHGLWMHNTSTLIEVDTGFRCHCFYNIATWSGINYERIFPHELENFLIK